MPSLGTAASKAGFLEPDLIYGSLDPFPMPPVLSGSPQSLRSTWYPMEPFWSPATIMCVPLKLGNDFAKGRYSAPGIKKPPSRELANQELYRISTAMNYKKALFAPLIPAAIHKITGIRPGHAPDVTWIGNPVACPSISISSAALR